MNKENFMSMMCEALTGEDGGPMNDVELFGKLGNDGNKLERMLDAEDQSSNQRNIDHARSIQTRQDNPGRFFVFNDKGQLIMSLRTDQEGQIQDALDRFYATEYGDPSIIDMDTEGSVDISKYSQSGGGYHDRFADEFSDI
tara:strand:+ start:1245 stop:1667 length:423 start_codon:yes stop_codon:yes gene_type:complete